MTGAGGPQPTVIYLAGWGRSGTTLVSRLLGGYSGLVNVGEVERLWVNGLEWHARCGCGEPVRDCSFWRRVLATAYGVDGLSDHEIREIDRMQAEYRSTLRIPWWVVRRRLSGDAFPGSRRLAHLLERLYPAISEVAGGRTVVDSSKSPTYLNFLASLQGIRVFVVHVVRNPVAIAYSWRHGRPVGSKVGLLGSTAKWIAWNSAIELLRTSGSLAGAVTLRYEDFVRSPRASIEEIVQTTGVPAGAGPFLSENSARVGVQHTCWGNPNRMGTESIVVEPDLRWKHRMPRLERHLVAALSLPLSARYGYARGAGTVSPER